MGNMKQHPARLGGAHVAVGGVNMNFFIVKQLPDAAARDLPAGSSRLGTITYAEADGHARP